MSIGFIHAGSYGGSTESSGRVLLSKDLDHDIEGVDVLNQVTLSELIAQTAPNVIINCVGIVKQREQASDSIA